MPGERVMALFLILDPVIRVLDPRAGPFCAQGFRFWAASGRLALSGQVPLPFHPPAGRPPDGSQAACPRCPAGFLELDTCIDTHARGAR